MLHRGIGKQRAVLVVDDEGREVRVRLGELGEELAVEGVVDGFPEAGAAGADGVYVAGGGLSDWCLFRRVGE